MITFCNHLYLELTTGTFFSDTSQDAHPRLLQFPIISRHGICCMFSVHSDASLRLHWVHLLLSTDIWTEFPYNAQVKSCRLRAFSIAAWHAIATFFTGKLGWSCRDFWSHVAEVLQRAYLARRFSSEHVPIPTWSIFCWHTASKPHRKTSVINARWPYNIDRPQAS